jgi:hypothetical protein
MVPYAVLADVQDQIPQFELSSTTKPNSTQVASFIGKAETEFDVRLGTMGYTTPLTGSVGLAWAKILVSTLAAAKTLYARAAAVGGEAAVVSADRMAKWVEDQFGLLAKGVIVLSGEEGGVEGAEDALTNRIRGFLPDNSCPDQGPRIWMGKVF